MEIIGAIIGIVLGFMLEAWFFQLAWNLLLPVVWAAAPHCTYLMAVAAIILFNLIFRRGR
jgi:predicted lysophospholipase L1 biosynthesis ABC-type transport system permease subunit